MKAQRWGTCIAYSFLNLGAIRGKVVNVMSRKPRERESVPTALETGWVPDPVSMGEENLASRS